MYVYILKYKRLLVSLHSCRWITNKLFQYPLQHHRNSSRKLPDLIYWMFKNLD